MATALRLQPQRQAIGELTIAGKPVPVFITKQWYRNLEQIVASIGSEGSTTDDTEDDLSGPVLLGGSESTGSVGSEGFAADVAVVLLVGLQQGMQALEGDAVVQQLQAQVAQLQEQVAGLLQGNEPCQ